jgi:sugar phosphate isomerase/epimerase
MVELMQSVSSQAVGVLWDTHHPWRFCGEPLAETYQRLKPWTRHTHWKDSVTRTERTTDAAREAADAQASALMSGHRPADYVLFGGGEFPIAECLQVLLDGGYEGWFSLEWEKAWHPEIEAPEVALPLFPEKLKQLATLLRSRSASFPRLSTDQK